MKSLDTNVLLYALNADCPEHEACAALLRAALAAPESWIVADQVWFELYRLLRNPAVVRRPLGAKDAASAVAWYRDKSGWQHCHWNSSMMGDLSRAWGDPLFPARRVFDLVLAITLKSVGVKDLYTRNVKDFATLGFFAVSDPLEL